MTVFRRVPQVDDTKAGSLMVFAAAAGFGTLAIFGKLAIAIGLNLETLLLFRFFVATTLLWLALVLTGRARILVGRQLLIALAVGVVYAAMTWLFFEGLKSLTAGIAAIVFYTYPIYVFVISSAILDERITRTKLLALVTALAGVVLIIGGGPSGGDFVGIAFVLLAAIGYATYTTGSRVALATVDASQLTATAMIATTISMIPPGLLSGRLTIPVRVGEWGVILGIAIIGTAVPIGLFIMGLSRIEASNASIIGTSEPLMTVLLGVILLGESVTFITAFGGALVLTGVLLIQRDGHASTMVAH